MHEIEFRGVSQAKVARGAGIADFVPSEILHGKREMGLKTIETLAGCFRVEPGLFVLETAGLGRPRQER